MKCGINGGKRDDFRSSPSGKEYKEKYKYNYAVLEPQNTETISLKVLLIRQ
jgi:hypothetical protein